MTDERQVDREALLDLHRLQNLDALVHATEIYVQMPDKSS